MYTQTDEQIEIDLGRLFKALWRGKEFIFWITALFSVLALLVSALFVAPRYESSVLFYVTGVGVNPAMVVLETGETLDGIRIASGTSWSNRELEKMLSAESVDDTGFFRITATCQGAGNAVRLANAAAQVMPQRVPQVIPSATLYIAEAPRMAEEPSVPNHPKVALIAGLTGFALSAGTLSLQVIFTPAKRKRRK